MTRSVILGYARAGTYSIGISAISAIIALQWASGNDDENGQTRAYGSEAPLKPAGSCQH